SLAGATVGALHERTSMHSSAKRIAMAVVAAIFLPAAQAADTVVVTADRLLDVLAGRTIERPAVLVVDGRIRAVGAQGTLAEPEGARHLDLPGDTLLPGLIDMHVHLTADPRIGGHQDLDVTNAFWAVIGVPNAKAMLEAGFTTV